MVRGRLTNITKTYLNGGAECAALKGVNLELPDKGLVFIEGRSGSGKTTLLNIIAGIDKPTEGEFTHSFGENYCAMVFQDFQLIDLLTVRQNLELVPNIMSNAKTDIAAMAEKYGLTDILDKFPNQISGGQKQRVAVVRAVLENRPVLACDEPTGNLDEENAKIIASLLKSEANDKLILVVSHDTELFTPICDEHIKLKNGVMEKDGENIAEKDGAECIGSANPSRKVNIGFKSQCLLSWKIVRKSLAKNILLAVALVLSFSVLFSALNGLLNTDGRVIYNVHRAETNGKMELALQDPLYSDGWNAMGESDYKDVAKYGDIEARFVDSEQELVDGNKLTRLYVADKCERKILCGNSNTDKNTVLVSDYIADRLLEYYGIGNYSDLIGKNVFEDCVLGGIFKTDAVLSSIDFSDYAVQNSELMLCELQTAYVSQSVIDELNKSSWGACLILNGTKATPYSPVYRDKPNGKIEYGELRELYAGEAGISLAVARHYTDEPQELLGKTIDVEFVNYRSESNRIPYSSSFFSFKVAYIFSGLEALTLSAVDCDAVLENYGGKFYGKNVWGVRLKNYTKSGVGKLLKKGYTDASALSSKISNGIEWLKPLTYIELAVGVVLLIITTVILFNHVASVVDKEKRTLGVLVSFGLKVRQTVFTYLAGTVCILLASLMLGAVAAILGVTGINAIMLKFRISSIKVFFYEPLSVLCIFAIFAVLMLLIYFTVVRKLRKKQIVDIIYER